MQRWAFGEFILDLETRELLRAGEPVSLSPKAFQLLGILVQSRPKATSKAELQDRLWPRTFVVEKNLTNLVGEIRGAVGDDAGHPRFIRTVARFGYAFRESPPNGFSEHGADGRSGGAAVIAAGSLAGTTCPSHSRASSAGSARLPSSCACCRRRGC